MACIKFAENYRLRVFNGSLYVCNRLVCVNETTYSKESSDSIPQKSPGWGGRGWVFIMPLLIIFSPLFQLVPVPGVQTAVAVRDQRAYESLKERRWFSSSVQNSHSGLHPKKVISLSSAQLWSPPKAWSPPRLNAGLLRREKCCWEALALLLARNIQSLPEGTSWLSQNILHVAVLSLTWHFFACVTKK